MGEGEAEPFYRRFGSQWCEVGFRDGEEQLAIGLHRHRTTCVREETTRRVKIVLENVSEALGSLTAAQQCSPFPILGLTLGIEILS
ncbi:unnamed protein product, partial [Allacma fusca]